jgi:hypothetical protein
MGTKVYDNALDLLTFSRASGGTSLRKISYGSELFSDFTAEVEWVDNGDGSWTVTSATANADLRVDNLSPLGTLLEFSYDVTTTANLIVYHQQTGPITTTPTGSHTVRAVSNSTFFIIRAVAGTTATVSNISVKEVLFDQPAGTLTLFNHPDNIPRIDYNADGTVKGLLIEEQRTNLITYSNDFTNAAWLKGTITVTANDAVSPDGTTNADYLSIGASGYIQQNFTHTIGQQYTVSAWVKSYDGTDELFRFYGEDTSLSGDFTATSEWQRFSYTYTATKTSGGDGITRPSTNVAALLHVYGFQVEAGSFPTSYIPTSGATATRSADIASIPVTDFGYNQGIGSLVVEADPIPSGSGFGTKTILDINNGGVNSQISLINENSDRCRLILDPEDTTNDADITVIGAEGSVMYAAAWKLNSANAAHGGILGTEDTSNAPIKNATQVTISSDAGGNAKFSGHIKSIQFYPRRLTNTQLQELTS